MSQFRIPWPGKFYSRELYIPLMEIKPNPNLQVTSKHIIYNVENKHAFFLNF